MIEIFFTKIKTTNQLFFKRDKNRIRFINQRVTISTLPFFEYPSQYYIREELEKTNVYMLFRVVVWPDKDNERDFRNPLFDDLQIYEEWNLYVTHSGSKTMLYDDSRNGIILKG